MIEEHQGHRERVKEKLLNIGLDKFAEHEVIELLLFFGIPYKDTNLIAHNLMKKFGSLSGVLDASVEDLFAVKGMTKNAAILLNLIPQLFREYKKSKCEKRNPVLNIDDILPLIEANLQYRDMESLYVICLNAKQRITAVVETGVADLSSVLLSPRSIMDIALRYKAVNLIIAHNHPSGIVYPSDSDIALTIELKHMLKSIDIDLVDHIIIAEDKAYSFFLRGEIRGVSGCAIKPYDMRKTEHTQMPENKVVQIVRKNDGSFERIG